MLDFRDACVSAVLVVLLASACGSESDTRTDHEAHDAQSGENNDDSEQACEPIDCDNTDGCGAYDDGCGGSIVCEQACACTDNDFETACPQRPCERVAGCTGGACVYAPILCGGKSCEPVACSGDGCELICTTAGCDQGIYPCGAALCTGITEYCDPAPTVAAGQVSYGNVCVAPPSSGCGTCGLGVRECAVAIDRFTCTDVVVPVLDLGGTVNCDSTASASTFIYVDTDFIGGSNGSRQAPFATFQDGLNAAEARNTRGVVIAGSPTFTKPLQVKNGISVYGGYGRHPNFHPDPSQRPTWEISAAELNEAKNQLVGAEARDIDVPTVLDHLKISTANVTHNDGRNGASNIGLLAVNAAALIVEDVLISAGDATHGVHGSDGSNPGPDKHGGPGLGREPGVAAAACQDACTTAALHWSQSNVCGLGGAGAPGYASGGLQGNPGDAASSVTGGTGGESFIEDSCFSGDATAGGAGAVGISGAAGSAGMAGLRAMPNAGGAIQHTPGTDGAVGGRGSWGGGGGGGGGYMQGCMNDPHEGGHGGGGGAPGCGGDYGSGGGGGGLSIGVAAIHSDLQIAHCVIEAGDGGHGGRGGRGAQGGSGNDGETRTDKLCPDSENHWHAACGGPGGKGGDGGRGGDGGSGAGGDSVGIYCVQSSLAVTDSTVFSAAAGLGGDAAAAELHGDNGASQELYSCWEQ